MKAISLHQPWASEISQGLKRIETRMWRTRYRGDLLIVASKKPEVGDLPTGQALCIATLIDCRPMTMADEMAAKCACEPGRYAWVLRNIRPVEPFRVKGQLGLYEVDDMLIGPDCRNCNGMEGGCDMDGLCCV